MYILIDGENIDATLGVNILKRAPHPEERPRWDRVLKYNPWDPDAEEEGDGLFYMNASQRTAMTFVQALLAIGWKPVLLTSEDPHIKIVDVGIQRTLDAIAVHRPGADIVIASHDVDYLPQVSDLLDAGHRVAIICFREYLSAQLAELEDRGLKIVDLEYDVAAFNQTLNRIYPIDIDDFDPLDFI
ncbi:NYN domain-containing protein [Trueperella pyogenes]|uniref:NYN domain-containing protein n=1 Tax=Trueperella pyogenes TaxID=1661 RepID=A0A3S9QLP7_9ACTO|nr:NYN domain-containing protein [Trueperella pyogenes]AZR06855.1 NYN domain-containing protein [Trueperella pyogenes]MCI7690239.1 NYN domain-containing protein [Trueperella pyogenes]QIU87032.1 NYN domain-containing protein [Trueperella pyogenes]